MNNYFIYETCTTTAAAVYHYFHYHHMNNYFHYEMYLYRRRVRLLPRCPMNAYFIYDHYENVYFPYTASNSNRSEMHASKV